MARIPNEALGQRSRRSDLAHARELELRQLHPLIAKYLDELSYGPQSLDGSGLNDYSGVPKLFGVDDVVRRYRCVKPHYISPRNLTRVIQFSIINSMDFPKDDFFNAQLRQLVFGVVKAAAILQAGHHLGEKYRKYPFKIRNHPKLREVKQKAVERFAVRWLDLSLDAQAQLLPASDREKLLETFDSVNDISNGELASLVKRSLISDMPLASVRPSIESDGIQPIARTRFLGFLDRRQTRNRD